MFPLAISSYPVVLIILGGLVYALTGVQLDTLFI